MWFLPRLNWALSRTASLSLFKDQREPAYFVIHCIWRLENANCTCFVIHKTHKIQPWLLFCFCFCGVKLRRASPREPGLIPGYSLHVVSGTRRLSKPGSCNAAPSEYLTKSPMCWTGLFFSAWNIEQGFQSIMKHLKAGKTHLFKEQ